MNYNPMRQYLIRIGICSVVFLLLTTAAAYIGLPAPWSWAGMVTLLIWTQALRHVV